MDACYWIHGGLSVWMGAPTFRIDWIRTRRVLGISAPGYENGTLMPPLVYGQARMDADTQRKTVYGDFLVCPFTPDAPDRMRMVCIEQARNLVIEQETRDAAGKPKREVTRIGPRGDAVPPGRSVPAP